MKLLSHLLTALIQTGALKVVWPNGETSTFSGAPGPEAAVRIKDPALLRRLLLNPELAFGEAYMDGTLQPEGCDLYDLLHVVMLNRHHLDVHPLQRWLARMNWLLRRRQQNNDERHARQNVSHHYDLSNDLYRLFLDEDMQYSCGYFASPDDSLEEAQHRKKIHIAAKLQLEPGQRVLDIGCGWGGMALSLAQVADVEVLGVTLSTEQLELAQQRARALGLEKRVRFELRDYRTLEERFDRIVSVGMFEHVGVSYFDAFFKQVEKLLADDGLALLHSIGRMTPPGGTGPWLRKYIFPGGYTPALSEVFAATERVGLWVTDVEMLRVHYAETLRHWRQRFAANREIARAKWDERFCRMWEFYLTACELHFRIEGGLVFQMQLARDRAAAPLTRDYIGETEQKMLQSVALQTGLSRAAAE